MLSGVQFDNRFAEQTKGTVADMRTPRQITDAIHLKCTPVQVQRPRLLAWSTSAAQQIGWPSHLVDHPTEQNGDSGEMVSALNSHLLAKIFCGNILLEGMAPCATVYGGHQFGHWAGQLGDGRAMLLGETGGFELQLKGAGKTPLSRGADGRAVLRSSLREYVCSEAMYHLGIPTTRALSLSASGEMVVRDMFYDGRPAAEHGAIVCRTAPSFIRFGHFELLAARGDVEGLRALADFTIRHYYPELLAPADASIATETYLRWFDAVCRKTVAMIVGWMRVGFVHGVMNTDNMSILGLTIDYGPFGWVEDYNPRFTPNTSDRESRYCFGNQPAVAMWNLGCLANALLPLINDADGLSAVLGKTEALMTHDLHDMNLRKVGLVMQSREGAKNDDARELIERLQGLMARNKMDFTRTYAVMAKLSPESGSLAESLSELSYEKFSEADLAGWTAWLTQRSHLAKVALEEFGIAEQNPSFVPRNWLLVEAADQLSEMLSSDQEGKIKDDFEVNTTEWEHRSNKLQLLLQAAESPYRAVSFAKKETEERLYGKRPDWAAQLPGAAALSCSS